MYVRSIRKGTNGFSTNGVTANLFLFEGGTFWVLPLTYFCLPQKVPGCTFFPNLSKFITFAAAPLAWTSFVRKETQIFILTILLIMHIYIYIYI